MTNLEIRLYMVLYPQSDIARAYAMGLKDKTVELSDSIEKLISKKLGS